MKVAVTVTSIEKDAVRLFVASDNSKRLWVQVGDQLVSLDQEGAENLLRGVESLAPMVRN